MGLQALRACADTVHGNAPLQERFAQLQVNYMDPNSPIDSPQQNGDNKVYVIEGLLDVALLSSSIHAFDARVAACTCLEVPLLFM